MCKPTIADVPRDVIVLSRDQRTAARGDAQPPQAGFSLLELVVTIGIGAILLSVGVPSLTAMSKNANIVTASNDFLMDLHYARDLAVTRNQRVMLCPSTSGLACDSVDWTTGWVVFVDNDRDQSVDADEPIERAGEELSGLSLDSGQFANSITFRPNGRAMGDAVTTSVGAFLMCDDRGSDHARGIIVDYGGRPRVTHLASIGAVAVCPDIP
jgi:type IV fimbrial biogenesis protein FimT